MVKKREEKVKLSAAQRMRMRKPPGVKSYFKNGYFDLRKSSKYNGDLPVQYRSGLELSYFNMFENSETIIDWKSEPDLGIKYLHKGKISEYVVDASYTKRMNNGSLIYVIAEIKPFDQTYEPNISKYKKVENYEYDKVRFDRNYDKWEAAHKFAIGRGWRFVILTDKGLTSQR